MLSIESSFSYVKGTLYEISVNNIHTDPNQPRKYFDPAAQQDLVNSIQKQGVLQPILFRTDQGMLFIVAGERRLQAAKEAGIETIPAILVEGDYAEIALVENLLRQDLTAIEIAEALDRIMKEHGYNQEQLTGIVGKAKSTVSEILSLNRLPNEIRNECRNDLSISRKTLIAIAKKKKPQAMLRAYKRYKAQSLLPKKLRDSKDKKKTWHERFTTKYDALTTFVTGVDFETLDASERNDLIARFTELKKTAANLLAKIKGSPVKKTLITVESVSPKASTNKQKPATAPGKEKKVSPSDKPQTIMMDIV